MAACCTVPCFTLRSIWRWLGFEAGHRARRTGGLIGHGNSCRPVLCTGAASPGFGGFVCFSNLLSLFLAAHNGWRSISSSCHCKALAEQVLPRARAQQQLQRHESSSWSRAGERKQNLPPPCIRLPSKFSLSLPPDTHEMNEMHQKIPLST